MKWTKENLDAVPISGGYKLRGASMTRIEVFSDAAFAFAVTMLVISLSSIPQNSNELVVAIKGIPSFALSFAIMMLIWIQHRRWSQRFGLDDGISSLLTLSLVFIVLVYVYPLKLIMDIMCYGLSGGWLPSKFELTSVVDVAILVAFFGTGFCLVALIQLGLYLRVKSLSKDLRLSPLEQLLVQKEQLILVVQAVAGFLSAAVAVIFMTSIGYLAGILLALIPIAVPLVTLKTNRKIRAAREQTSDH